MRTLEEYDEDYWRRQTPLGIALKVLAFFLVLGLIISVIGWFAGWFNEAKRVTGPANTSAQYQAVIGDWQALISSAQNACSAERTAHSDGDPTFVEDPALAYEATFRRTREDYNRRMHNFFEAGLVGPSGYPKTVPFYPTSMSWCTVADKLVALHD